MQRYLEGRTAWGLFGFEPTPLFTVVLWDDNPQKTKKPWAGSVVICPHYKHILLKRNAKGRMAMFRFCMWMDGCLDCYRNSKTWLDNPRFFGPPLMLHRFGPSCEVPFVVEKLIL